MNTGDDRAAFHLGREVRNLLALAGPMIVAQGGLTTMGLVDTFWVGRVSTEDMAAVALGNALALLASVFAFGTAMGIEPLASQAHGAGEARRARAWRIQGLWATVLVSIPSMLFLVVLIFCLPWLEWTPGFEAQTQMYLVGRLPGVVLAGGYSVYRAYLTSVGRSRPALMAVLAANVANLGLDVLFLFGWGWGAFGVGLATSISSGVMLWVSARAVRETAHPDDRRPVWADLRSVFRLGWPIAGQLGAEIGIFTGASTLVALEGPVILSGHQIALNLSSVTFMSAVGIGVGATARVGNHIGAGRTTHARKVGFLSIGLGSALMLAGAVVFWAVPGDLARTFAPESPDVQAMTVTLLQIAAVFALSDGIQAVAAGALRGAGETRSTFVANVAGHGLVGVPVGLYLGWSLGLGAVGYWWGLTAGLTATAVVLVVRFARLTGRPIARVESVPVASASRPAPSRGSRRAATHLPASGPSGPPPPLETGSP